MRRRIVESRFYQESDVFSWRENKNLQKSKLVHLFYEEHGLWTNILFFLESGSCDANYEKYSAIKIKHLKCVK